MTELFYEKYDGEMIFDISDVEFEDDKLSFVIKAEYNEKTVGAAVTIPVIVRRSFFKTTKLIKNSAQLVLSSIGEESDNFVVALEELFKPAFRSSRKFTDEPEGIDYSILNRELYDIDSDKIYVKLYNAEDQSDFEEDEKINLEINFAFNLKTKKASLIEVRDGYSADLIAIIMK